jgi:hypothetical protein
MKIKLTRKLADHLDGVDVTPNVAGDVLNLPRRQAELLVAEGWAEPIAHPLALTFPVEAARLNPSPVGDSGSDGHAHDSETLGAGAAGASQPVAGTLERLRKIREQLEHRRLVDQERRRAEDRIRDQLHDSRSRIVPRTG